MLRVMSVRSAGVVLVLACLFAPVSFGSLTDTFDPPNPNVTPMHYGNLVGLDVLPGGPTGQFLRMTHDGVNSTSNGYAYHMTDPGLYSTINAGFDFRITSTDRPADGFAFVLLPTGIYGPAGSGAYVPGTAMEAPDYPGVFGVGFDIYPSETNLVTAHWDGAQVDAAPVEPAAVDFVAGVFHHVDLSLEFVTDGANLSVDLTSDVHGASGPTITAFDELFIPGLAPYEYRVEFAARTGGLNASIDIDNINVTPTRDQGPPAVPVPGAVLLGTLGAGMVTWLRRRKMV